MIFEMTSMEQVALQIAEMLDAIYMHSDNPTGYSIRIGVWSTEDVTYSIYAGLYSDNGNAIIAGESSYGSMNLAEAIQALSDEASELWTDNTAEPGGESRQRTIMYIENPQGNKPGILAEQQADEIAEAIKADREKGRRFLRQMGEDDSEEAIDNLIEEWSK